MSELAVTSSDAADHDRSMALLDRVSAVARPAKVGAVVSAGVAADRWAVFVSAVPAASRARTIAKYVVAGVSPEIVADVAPGAVVWNVLKVVEHEPDVVDRQMS